MPTSTDPGASVVRSGEALRFAGALTRAHVAGAWQQALGSLAGVRHFDVTAVSTVDSAGIALLAELAGRIGTVAIDGDPPGLAELRSAYRLDRQLRFSAS